MRGDWREHLIVNVVHSGLAALPSLLLLTTSTATVSYLFHVWVVKRSPMFAFLLNGQSRDSQPRPAMALGRAAA